MKANDNQIGGTHYAAEFQHWDWVEALRLPYLLAQISRYTCRWKKKNGLEDVRKALHYVHKQREVHEATLAKYRGLTEAFATANELGEHEREVFSLIVQYHSGGLGNLKSMQHVLENMLRILESKPVEGITMYTDPNFRV